jgi:UDP-N-acetylglucosamine 2-epimerase (non-hydrolysing)
MPEEVNRVLTDRISDLLLTPSTDVDVQLATEGLGSIPMAFVGNVMIDSLYKALPYAQSRPTLKEHGVERDKYIVATLHRPSNVDESGQLSVLLKALAIAAEKYPVVFPIHPRTRQKATDAGLEVELSRLITTEPLSYSEMIGLLDGAKAVITDSGGLQEETTVLGVPCLTVRAQTERPITISQGTNALATWPPTVKGLADEAEGTAAKERYPVGKLAPEGWDGRAATRIVDALQLHTK